MNKLCANLASIIDQHVIVTYICSSHTLALHTDYFTQQYSMGTFWDDCKLFIIQRTSLKSLRYRKPNAERSSTQCVESLPCLVEKG